MSCAPQQREMTAADWAKLDPCAKLEIVEFALTKLASGEKATEIRHGEHWVRFGMGSVTYLERERSRLSALCNRNGRHSISVGFPKARPAGPYVPGTPYRRFGQW